MLVHSSLSTAQSLVNLQHMTVSICSPKAL